MSPLRLLIAGPSEQVSNYLSAFTALGADCQTLPHRMAPHSCNPLPSSGIHADTSGSESAFLPGLSSQFDALVLPGGGDIDPLLFQQKNRGSRAIDPELDRLQLFLLRSFLQKGVPVLGICKGMQLINVCFKGGIIQNLPSARQHAFIGRDQVHLTYAQQGSILHSLYGECFPVNSAHHQGIAEPGQGLIVIQRAPDGVAEALVHAHLPVLGVQWHPERMCFSHRRPETPDGSLLLAYFLSLCRISR